MSTAKPTAKPSSLETFDLDIETKVSKPVDTFNLLRLIGLIKDDYDLKTEFTFRLLCRRIKENEAIPVMIAIEINDEQTAAKPSKKKVAKNIIIHYDKLKEMLDGDRTIKLSFGKIKKISPTCYNIFVKGESEIKIVSKAEWKNGKSKMNNIQYINHVLKDIDSDEKMMARINAEIQAYDIPVPEIESDNKIDINDKDDDVFDD